MTYKKYVFVAVLVAGLTISPAWAANRDRTDLFYYGLQAGPSFLSGRDAFSSRVAMGYTLEANLGYKFTHHLRADLSLDYTRNKFKGSSRYIGQIHALINGYYDMPINNAVPYIGVGLGYVNIKASEPFAGLTTAHGHDGFGWKLGAGLNYRVTDKVDIGVGYRLLVTDLSGERDSSVSVWNHAVKGSFSYYFGRRYGFDG